MSDTIEITYNFLFESQESKEFSISLDKDDLIFITKEKADPPDWTHLNQNQCNNCTLDSALVEYCPVALNLQDMVEAFRDCFSYETVKVMVTTPERTYSKTSSLQESLSSLIGIIMVTSTCPIMEKLKPMVRFHLPFATLEETIFRMASMYLLAQYFLQMENRQPDWELTGLKKIYAEVGQVNRDFAERLKRAAEKDANANALVKLDCFAKIIPMAVEEMLQEIRIYFSPYLQ